MKTQDEIEKLVEATLAVADDVAAVSPPDRLKAEILSRITQEQVPVLRPQWLRPALTAAAAVLILAVNIFTIRHLAQPARPAQFDQTDDAIGEIRSAYGLDSENF